MLTTERWVLYLHEVVIDASQSVRSADILFIVPLIHQGALILDMTFLTEALA